MDITRRDFILATGATAAAGLVLPSWHRTAVAWLERTGEPLLEPVPRAETVIYAEEITAGEYQLHLGPPNVEPPVPTWREYLAFYREHHPSVLTSAGIDADAPITRELLQRYLLHEWGPVMDSDLVRNADLDSPAEVDSAAFIDPAYEQYKYDWWGKCSSVVEAFDYLSWIDWPDDSEGRRVVGGLLFEQDGGVFGDYRGVHACDAVSLSLLPHVLAGCGKRVEVRLA